MTPPCPFRRGQVEEALCKRGRRRTACRLFSWWDLPAAGAEVGAWAPEGEALCVSQHGQPVSGAWLRARRFGGLGASAER